MLTQRTFFTTAFVLAVAGPAYADFADNGLHFSSANARLYAGPYTPSIQGNDWSLGSLKAECSLNNGMYPQNVLSGISANVSYGQVPFPAGYYHSWLHTALCTNDYLEGLAQYSFVDQWEARWTLHNRTIGDSRQENPTTGDWAPGYAKVECTDGYAATGISQKYDSTGQYEPVSTILCRKTNRPSYGSCHYISWTNNLLLTKSNNQRRADATNWDWDVGYYKMSCSENEYIKGVAVDLTGFATCDPNLPASTTEFGRNLIGLLCCEAYSPLRVAIKTYNGNYITAESDGGGDVSTNRTAVGAWEKFSIYGVNTPNVTSCDMVHIAHEQEDRTKTWVGSANIYGGGVFNTNSAERGPMYTTEYWDKVFWINKVGADCGAPIQNGDSVTFQSSDGAYPYMCAEGGGGFAGYGSVTVNRDWAAQWETFTLEFL